MKLTLIPSKNRIHIDGRCCNDIVLDKKYDNIHAIQWYDTWGEVEYCVESDGKKRANKKIRNLDDYQDLIHLHTAAVEVEEKAKAEESR